MTHSQYESILNNLEEKHIIKKNGNCVIFSDEIRTDFLKFAELLKKPPYDKTILIIPEYRIDLLKLIFFETFYSVIEEIDTSVQIVTDNSGRSFILEFLSEYEADRGNLKTLFLKYYKDKISFHLNKNNFTPDENIITIFYRKLNCLLENKVPARSICIITLEDINRLGQDFQKFICELKKESWNLFNFSEKDFIPSDCEFIKQEKCDFPQIWNDNAKKISEYSELCRKIIDESYLFYSTVCLPLKKTYDEWDITIDKTPLYPSKKLKSDVLISNIEKESLFKLFLDIEQILEENNPKYEKLNSIFTNNLPKGKNQCIILPSDYSIRSFVDYYQGNKDTILLDNSECTVLTQEELFFKLSYSNQNYYRIVFPFLPNPLSLILSKKFAEQIIFILYPEEISLFEMMMRDTHIFLEQLSSIFNCEENFRQQSEYSKYLDLFRQHTKTSLSPPPPPGLDHNFYIFTGKDKQIIKIRGEEDVILYRRKFSQPSHKYLWTHPQTINENDVVIFIPDEIRKEILIDFMKKELIEKADEIELYIEYLACWKKGLYHIEQSELSMEDIIYQLKKGGLSKDPMTIRGWFRGIGDDAIKCALNSLINKDMNIGPRNEEDIYKFAHIFDLGRIKDNYLEIFNSMNYFREILRNKGFYVSNKIIHELDDYEFKARCNMMRIGKIEVKLDDKF